MDPLLKTLLSPFCVLYGLGLLARDALYRSKLLKSFSFDIPTIGVGNLSTGGTGKTPMIKYLARLLMPDYQCAIMSRGYKRLSKGYVAAGKGSSFTDIGDEPYELMNALPGVHIAVAESRVQGIPELMMDFPDTEIILLDDIFQHRALKPGLNILLTDFLNPYYEDQLLPSGRLRDFKAAHKRADIIIMTKCPAALDIKEQEMIKQKLKPYPYQEVFFASFQYGLPRPVFSTGTVMVDGKACILFSGIAKSSYFNAYISKKFNLIHHFDFPDHHRFTLSDLEKINKKLLQFQSENPVILCTAKDAARLEEHKEVIENYGWQLFEIPVEMIIINGKDKFDRIVREFVNKFEAK